MANNSSVQHSGGFLPDRYTVDPNATAVIGEPDKCPEEVLYLQSMFPPKRFDDFPPVWGMLRRFKYVEIFL